MLTVRDHIHIAAPPEEVFAFLDQPERHTECIPSLTESSLIQRLENGGSRVRFTARFLGLNYSGEMRTTDYTPPERIIWSLSGDLHGTIRWYLESTENGTSFTCAVTYVPPGPSFLHLILPPLVRHYTERELQKLLARLKSAIDEG